MGTDEQALPDAPGGSSGADAWICLAASAAAGSAYAAMVGLMRLPASADLILPRRPAYALFEPAMRLARSPFGRQAVAAGALALLVGAALLFLWRAAVILRGRRTGWAATAGWLVAGLAMALAARAAVSCLIEVVYGAWFPAESLDLAEPAWAFALVAGTWFVALRGALSLLEAGVSGRFSRRWREPGLWVAGLLLIRVGAETLLVRLDGRKTLAQAAGLEPSSGGARTLLVLNEGPDGPGFSERAVPLSGPGGAGFTRENLARLEAYAGAGPSVHRRDALRRAMEGFAALGDAEGMRRAALAGHKAGDSLATLVLLNNLGHAPVTAASLSALDLLADERVGRVGGHAAILLSRAYARFNRPDNAAYWIESVSRDPLGIPAGLIPGLGGAPGALPPAAVKGRVSGAEGATLELFARDRSLEGEVLPATLVASAPLDSKGDFSFEGIAPGDYYLAILLPASPGGAPALAGPEGARRQGGLAVRLAGHRGDIRVSGKAVAVPPMALRR